MSGTLRAVSIKNKSVLIDDAWLNVGDDLFEERVKKMDKGTRVDFTSVKSESSKNDILTYIEVTAVPKKSVTAHEEIKETETMKVAKMQYEASANNSMKDLDTLPKTTEGPVIEHSKEDQIKMLAILKVVPHIIANEIKCTPEYDTNFVLPRTKKLAVDLFKFVKEGDY